MVLFLSFVLSDIERLFFSSTSCYPRSERLATKGSQFDVRFVLSALFVILCIRASNVVLPTPETMDSFAFDGVAHSIISSSAYYGSDYW
jgi:hypothetical protein